MKHVSLFFSIICCMSPAVLLAQNIGIGTTTPADRLTVRSASGGFGISQESADGTVRMGFYTTPSAGAYFQTHTNHDLQFATNNATAQMVLQKGTGFVGIGSTAPVATLHLRGNVPERLRLENSAALGANVRNDLVFRTGSFFAGQIRTTGTGTNTARMGFYTGAQADASEMSERLTIGDNGMVGIGTVTPQHPLTFNSVLGDKISFWGGTGSATTGHYGIGIANSALQLYSAGPNDDIVFGHGRSGAFVENVRMKGNGNVGIGTNNPTAKLQVNGTIRIADGTQGANKVLVSSSDGTANWAGATYFRAALATVVNNSNNAAQTVIAGFLLNSNTYSSSQMINVSNGTVTVPTAGIYQLNLRVAARIPNAVATAYTFAFIEKFENGNWVSVAFEYVRHDGGIFQTDAIFKYHTVAFLEANQQLRIRMNLLPGAIIVGDDFPGAGPTDAEFSGVLMR